ncbi:MAG: PAS domain S-box protein [Planctomycetes bacterium]|nr:PAS domain S-box protein [Planctomycetota bacterium]
MANSSRGRRTAPLEADQEAHLSERVIQDKASLLASVVESADDTVIAKSIDGIITSWNSGAERIYGFSAKDVIGKSVSILIPPGQTDELPGLLGRIGRGESLHHYETVRRRMHQAGAEQYVLKTAGSEELLAAIHGRR